MSDNHREVIRERLTSIMIRANDALKCVGTEDCQDAIDDVLMDARVAQSSNSYILETENSDGD
jgi:hypothetical protein